MWILSLAQVSVSGRKAGCRYGMMWWGSVCELAFIFAILLCDQLALIFKIFLLLAEPMIGGTA